MTPERTLDALTRGLQQVERERMRIRGFRAAAVLVPLLDGPDGLELLFTVRAGHLSSHAGQIAFPGGAVDPGETIEGAARRETFEEIGLEIAADAVLGRLDDHPSPAGYVATPVVARIDWPQPIEPNLAEVAEVFTAPLAELRAITPRWEERQLREYRRRLHYYGWRDRLIWGFTGNVLKNLLDRLETGLVLASKR